MKHLIIRLGAALLTLAIGLAAQSIWDEKDYVIEWCGEFLLRGQD